MTFTNEQFSMLIAGYEIESKVSNILLYKANVYVESLKVCNRTTTSPLHLATSPLLLKTC